MYTATIKMKREHQFIVYAGSRDPNKVGAIRVEFEKQVDALHLVDKLQLEGWDIITLDAPTFRKWWERDGTHYQGLS